MKKFSVLFLAVSMIFMFSGISFADLNDGLVAYYPFNGNAIDATGNGNDGTVNGASLTEDPFGNLNSAYNFGGDDYIEIDYNEAFTENNSITVCAWVYVAEIPSSSPTQTGSMILSLHNANNIKDDPFFLGVETNGRIRFQIETNVTGASGLVKIFSTTIVDINKWYFVVGTYDQANPNDNAILYINGIPESTGDFNKPFAETDNNLFIGAMYSDNLGFTDYLNGRVDEVRIYNRALSDDEIQLLYHPPGQQIAEILDFFEASLANESLSGSGPGNSAEGRSGALRNMIQAAGELIAVGDTVAACQQLQDVYNRTDGETPPPDFVTGAAAPELADMIFQLMADLGCQ